MAYNEFIAAIRLGSSCLTGIVGKREPGGAFTVIAYDTEDSAGCIRRGNIRNVNETATRLKTLIAKLEKVMPASRIRKVFVGIGGQSVRSVEIDVSRTLGANTTVTDALMDELKNESKQLQSENLDALDVLEPACYLDGRLEPNPVGTLCSRIEAKYQQVVARHSCRSSVSEAVKLAGIGIKDDGVAGIIVSPLALADVVLSEDEKEMGCALIDFGGGVTSVAAYKKGRLLGLYVLPLGGNLITKDLSSHFIIVEADAEQIKREYGQAVTDDENPNTISVNTIDKKELRGIQLKEFYRVIAARQEEIIKNVHACLKTIVGEKEENNLKSFLRAGIFITGNASRIGKMEEAIRKCMDTDAPDIRTISSIRRDMDIKVAKQDMNPDFTSIGLLLQAEKNYVNCAVPPSPPPPPPPVKQPEPVAVNPVNPPSAQGTESTKEEGTDPGVPAGGEHGGQKGGSIWKKIKKKVDEGMDDLFKDAE